MCSIDNIFCLNDNQRHFLTSLSFYIIWEKNHLKKNHTYTVNQFSSYIFSFINTLPSLFSSDRMFLGAARINKIFVEHMHRQTFSRNSRTCSGNPKTCKSIKNQNSKIFIKSILSSIYVEESKSTQLVSIHLVL